MNNEYIKMCKEATEIQEGWAPKPGDKVYNDTFGFSHLPKEFVDEVVKDMDLFLPSQEDLQRIILIHKWHNVDRLLDEFMAGWNMPTGQFNDLTTLWLCFVMETVYNKQWTGDSWETLK